MPTYTILCSCGCGAQLGFVELSDGTRFLGGTGYGSYLPAHAPNGLTTGSW